MNAPRSSCSRQLLLFFHHANGQVSATTFVHFGIISEYINKAFAILLNEVRCLQWSKLQKQLESRKCNSLIGRIFIHSTRYRGTHDQEGKVWITFDKEIIQDFCTVKRGYKYNTLDSELRKQSNSTDYNDPEQRENYYRAYHISDEEMVRQGVHSQYEFYKAAEEYLNLSINEALASTNPIIRAMSVIDKRLGQRRLIKIHDDNPIVNRLLKIRLNVEGLSVPE